MDELAWKTSLPDPGREIADACRRPTNEYVNMQTLELLEKKKTLQKVKQSSKMSTSALSAV